MCKELTMKLCNVCGVRYPDSTLFCKKCHSLLHLEMHNPPKPNVINFKNRVNSSKNKILREHNIYFDWNPPAATTVYYKVKNIPYNELKYDLNRGFQPNGLRAIESNINSRKYHCAVCSYFVDSFCTYKEIKVEHKAICKSFEPKPELNFTDIPTKNEHKNRNITKEEKKQNTYCRICGNNFGSTTA